jgi:hypothetical protein
LIVGRAVIGEFVVAVAQAVKASAIDPEHLTQPGDAEFVVLMDQLSATVEIDADPQHGDEKNQQLQALTVPLVLTRQPTRRHSSLSLS